MSFGTVPHLALPLLLKTNPAKPRNILQKCTHTHFTAQPAAESVKALNTTNEILCYYIQLVQKNILLLAGEWESRISQPGIRRGLCFGAGRLCRRNGLFLQMIWSRRERAI